MGSFIQLLKLDQDGFIIEPVLFDMDKEEEYPDLHVLPYPGDSVFYVPKYEFETQTWVEHLTSEEIAAIEEENANRPLPPDPAVLQEELKQLQMAVNMLMLGGLSL